MRSWLLAGGAILAILSMPTLVLQAYEAFLNYRAYARYNIELLPAEKAAEIGGNHVVIKASSLHQEARSINQIAPVSVIINGHDYSARREAEFTQGVDTPARYYRDVALAMLADRDDDNKKCLAIVEGWGSLSSQSWSYRILLVGESRIKQEQFSYKERDVPSYRVPLIRLVGPPVGFHFDLLQLWPTWWYPILYPWVMFLIGAVAIFAGAYRARHRHHLRRAGPPSSR